MFGDAWDSAVAVILLAVAVSLDGWAAGMALGLRKVLLAPVSRALVAVFSGAMVGIAMAAGRGLTAVLAPETAGRAGGVLFLALGLALVCPRLPGLPYRRWWRGISQRWLGRFLQVRDEPPRADLDRSGTVQGWETPLLGAALGLDALAAGVAAALMELSLVGTVLAVTVAKALMLDLGLRLGARVGRNRPVVANVGAGLLFVLLALWSWF